MLINDHSAAEKKVMALAKKEKLELGSVSPTTEEHDMSTMSESCSNFDADFAQAMLDDHTKDIDEVVCRAKRSSLHW